MRNRRPAPAISRHPASPLPLLPSGPDGVHGWPSRGDRRGPAAIIALQGGRHNTLGAAKQNLMWVRRLARTIYEWPGMAVSVPRAARPIVRDSYDCRDAGGRAKQDARAEPSYGLSTIGHEPAWEATTRQAQTVTLRQKSTDTMSPDSCAFHCDGCRHS